LGELRGKVLGCVCHPRRCHADELVRAVHGEYIGVDHHV
jgi:hypothetical protein